MTPDEVYHTFAAAVDHGGSFYKLIGRAGLVADPSNRQRLLDAFPELVTTYGPDSYWQRREMVA